MKLKEIDGKPVVDSKKDVVLHILPEDVKAGRKRKPDCCAAAQACMRQMNAPRALVHLSRVYIEGPRKWTRFLAPPSLRTEIVSFDRGHRFEAGDYKLGKIPAEKALGSSRNYDHTRDGSRPKAQGKRRKYTVVKGVRFSASPLAYAA